MKFRGLLPLPLTIGLFALFGIAVYAQNLSSVPPDRGPAAVTQPAFTATTQPAPTPPFAVDAPLATSV